ncbi:MAG: isocitrate lyase/PEP mutase family protein [Rhodospirillales bacterium]|mgnify:FL=1|jgi:carboxyvinyl-carboxyphosphonate phosphorylmutase|nr:isocitrate lyase/PEP mutase family protein [Rhodospirillales bacterium]MDP6643514.1 isocitrate lyase/PEP mutase family protein [Rhodospirillales bacterium]MDP6840820.1 isocitrate lyase/PEP mutase family protein [Rhodospirillales bacterium]
MRWQARREKFRAILEGDHFVHPGSVFDPMSARIAEDLGFEVGMFAGSVASMAVLGAPDLILLTLSEFAGQAYRINRAGGLPLLCDADHGYGNALNVARTVEELENAGVAALTIEDTDLPVPFASGGKPSLISVDEGAGKMRAALAARVDPALIIAGRTSAMSIAGLDEAVRRIQAYAEAGVDALFLTGVKSRAELDALSGAVSVPLFLSGAPGELADPEYLSRRRVRVVLQGHMPVMAAMRAVHDTLKALRGGTPPAELEGVPGADFIQRITRVGDYQAMLDEYLGG